MSSVAVFAALADETRWSILTRIGASPASASALAKELPVSRQAITKHLELLSAVGLVTSERRGREVVHRALGEPLNETARQLQQVVEQWDTRLELIKDLAERNARTDGV
ncbi:ArsR/SmtB family transcription factor [Naumannella halotolerans]|uniref:ArsR/SmtB family transcription factor n=1 Tax=Naumannella halotolerans TaxID=993414 RepID=UPI00370D0A1E